jgi:NTP pyrophosphatase (non-canonical NTP hydrolase)
MTTITGPADQPHPPPSTVLADVLAVMGHANAMHTITILAALKQKDPIGYRDHDGPRLAMDLKAAGAAGPRQVWMKGENRRGYRKADLQRLTTTGHAGVAAFAATAHLREHFPADTLALQQVLCLAEETGECVAAYRRWAGLARRTGEWEQVSAELADVVITAYVTADVLGFDLDAAWQAKAAVVLTRGWRDTLRPSPDPA